MPTKVKAKKIGTKQIADGSPSGKPPTPKRIRPSIRFDTVNPSDFLKYDFTHSCEQCSHLDRDTGVCTLGYFNKVHREQSNLQSYELMGKMALCRFLEID